MAYDRLNPPSLGQQVIGLEVEQGHAPRRGQPIVLLVSYDGAAELGGVVLPIEVAVKFPDGETELRWRHTRSAPREVIFTPTIPGTYRVRIGETAHSLLWGSIAVEIPSTEQETGHSGATR